ncbi:MAG: DMT family transporter, partial [Spirochaetes bacterium]|nr:DMT family transporter [Spirochaetota bacterium]
IAFFQFASGLLLCLMTILIIKKPIQIINMKIWLLRGGLGVLTICLFYISIQLSSSGRASLLTNTFPIFVLLISFLAFKEPITRSNVISLIFCITGVLFVMYDGSNYKMTGDFIAIGSSISAAVAVFFVKILRKHNNSIIVYLSVCLFGLVLLPFIFDELVKLDIKNFIHLLLMGLLVFLAQVLLTYGIKFVSATKASVTTYFKIPTTLLLSYIFLSEQMTFRFLLGIFFISFGLLINSNIFDLIFKKEKV